jgi:hypothetical protein
VDSARWVAHVEKEGRKNELEGDRPDDPGPGPVINYMTES